MYKELVSKRSNIISALACGFLMLLASVSQNQILSLIVGLGFGLIMNEVIKYISNEVTIWREKT